MLTAKDKCAIISLSLCIAEAQGENGNSENCTNRIANFINRRNINNILVECAADMDIIETCDYVSELSEEKKKIIIWEILQVLYSADNASKEATKAFVAVVQVAKLTTAYEWYLQRRKNTVSSTDENLSDIEKTALVTIIRSLYPENIGPYVTQAITKIEQKYNISINSATGSNNDLYDAIDIVRITSEPKKNNIASELIGIIGIEALDKRVYKIEYPEKEILTEIFIETDLPTSYKE